MAVQMRVRIPKADKPNAPITMGMVNKPTNKGKPEPKKIHKTFLERGEVFAFTIAENYFRIWLNTKPKDDMAEDITEINATRSVVLNLVSLLSPSNFIGTTISQPG